MDSKGVVAWAVELSRVQPLLVKATVMGRRVARSRRAVDMIKPQVPGHDDALQARTLRVPDG